MEFAEAIVTKREGTPRERGPMEEEKPVERRCRETAQCSLSPADTRQFPPGGRPADERSTGSLLINRFAARRKYRRAPAHKPILAETRRPLIRAGQYKHVHKPVSESDAAGEMHRGRYCSQANFGQVKEPRNTQTTRNAIETPCFGRPVQFAFP